MDLSLPGWLWLRLKRELWVVPVYTGPAAATVLARANRLAVRIFFILISCLEAGERVEIDSYQSTGKTYASRGEARRYTV